MKLSRREILVGAAATAVASTAQASTRFEICRVALSVPTLSPAHDGLTVAQLSDVHTGCLTPDDRILAAVRAVNGLNADLVVLTGDYVSYDFDRVGKVGELLGGIRGPTFAVLGNHDHWTHPAAITRQLTGCGYEVLANQHTRIPLRGESFTLFGIDDGKTKHDDVDRTFRGSSENASGLVLTHAPSTARKLVSRSGMLCLSGHTHGGQVLIPGITPLIFGLANEPFFRGHYSVNGNQLYVNRGIGASRLAPRIRSEPEVTLFTIHSSGVRG